QSLLSGVHREIPEEHFLFYRRSFERPEILDDQRVILHIGAVDQVATVWVNGVKVGEHIGGYEHISLDITHALRMDGSSGENEIVIRAVDSLSRHILPYGKQTNKRGGMWYTPVSGIWQSVWLEIVPETYIEDLTMQTGLDWVELSVVMAGNPPAAGLAASTVSGTVTITTPEGEVAVELVEGRVRIELPEGRLWSPEDPYLYPFVVTVGQDRVESYFALRTVTVEKVEGIPRICLNGTPYFFHGILDQGYWSDGLLTPADPACFTGDILAMKELGFNMLRKHIKVEPELFYYECDRLGMIVAQDMVNNGDYNFVRDTALPTVGMKKRNDKNMHKDPQTRKAFLAGMEQTVDQLKNHPCICYWTIFNEGWGQFDSVGAYRKLKAMDDTRIIDTVSGWFYDTDTESDVVSEHVYFKPFVMEKSGAKKAAGERALDRPFVLSEFGGYCLAVKDHLFNPDKSYGYKDFKTQEEFEQALVALYEEQIAPAISQGLCGTVYTQVSDVEDEINGLLTYDRKVCKVNGEVMRAVAEKLKL
ncbi:MAG: glycoside hydrolase family 2, partial [Firmicutes bacterium]|nr:glycoside hydrolase family 2 [Bacillota bacterium]